MKYNICDIVDIYILKYSRYSLYWRLGCCLSSNLCLCRLLFTPFNIDIGAPACRDWFCLCSCLSRRQHQVHSQFIKSSRSSCDTPRFFLFVFRLGRSCSCLKNFFSKINSILVWDRHRSSPPTYAELRCSTRNSHRHPKSRVDYKDVATSALDADADWMSATQVWGHHYLENTCCYFISSIVYIKQFFSPEGGCEMRGSLTGCAQDPKELLMWANNYFKSDYRLFFICGSRGRSTWPVATVSRFVLV